MMPKMTEPTPPDARVQQIRAAAAALLLALIATGLAWELWLAPTGTGTWAIKVLPLALGILGVLRLRMHTYRWLSLLVWLYVAEGVVRGTTEKGLAMSLAWTQVLLSLLLFAACVAHVRWRLKKS